MTLQPFSLDRFPSGKPHLRQVDQFHSWERIVHKYSGCQLTYPEKDKLAAFAAVAQRFSPDFGEDYYAGHFRQNMPFDLVWHVFTPHSEEKSATRRHPTWSWTSVNSQILRVHATVFDRSLVEVEDGQRMHRNIWTVHSREIVGHDDHFSEMELIIDLDGPEKEIQEDVYFIPVLEFGGSGSKIRDIMGLALLKQEDGFYRRVGSWSARIDLSDLKSGPMFEVMDKYSDFHQVVVVV
ncbi:hypothetical protein INS49_010805 [Diaporthe citri]|uniref:uncharacterized protein n=1 Tax=Diaporthe citri TaxID=83186 RepID=UPI001C81F441|nr:uncharacterized protein INS49_010805 [Diaporthe citri]KAG6359753.1 hypothetical protein INS49_010805 [Diaporthe citri]